MKLFIQKIFFSFLFLIISLGGCGEFKGNYEEVEKSVSSSSIFVAVSNNGDVIKSSDGVNWESINIVNATNTNFENVKYINDHFAIVGALGGIYFSNDGIAWESKSYNTNDSFFDINYGNNIYLITGQNNTLLKSNDGSNWSSLTTSGLQYFNFDGENFISKSGISNNGSNFGSIGSDNGYSLKILNNNYIFISNGISYTPSVNCSNNGANLFKSTDGINWLQVSDSKLSNICLFDVGYGNGIYVTVGSSGTILTSYNLSNWTSRTSGLSVTFRGIAFGNGVFIVVGDSGTILTSQDGITWTERVSKHSNQINAISFSK